MRTLNIRKLYEERTLRTKMKTMRIEGLIPLSLQVIENYEDLEESEDEKA